MTTNYVKDFAGKPSATPTKAALSPAKGGALKGRSPEAAAGMQAVEQDRRRGQRVMLRVKVKIHVALQGKATTFETATVSVSPVGALVAMQRSLGPDTRLVLEHSGTRERVACKIARPPREMPDGFHTALEFDSPAADFWKIAFPPADWHAEDL